MHLFLYNIRLSYPPLTTTTAGCYSADCQYTHHLDPSPITHLTLPPTTHHTLYTTRCYLQSLGVETVDPNVMQRPPRNRQDDIITRPLVMRVLTSGMLILVGK